MLESFILSPINEVQPEIITDDRNVGVGHLPFLVAELSGNHHQSLDRALMIVEAGGQDLVLLKCTSTYPATPENSHLRTLLHLRELFGCEVGLSDHTMGVGAVVVAVALGATVIEKHFTLRRADGGVDSAFSLEPDELALLVTETERVWQALGSLLGIGDLQELRRAHATWVEEALKAEVQTRDESWSESLAIGSARHQPPGWRKSSGSATLLPDLRLDYRFEYCGRCGA